MSNDKQTPIYKAALLGSDIGRAPYVTLTARTLRGAKQQASRELGGGFGQHTIAVYEVYNVGTAYEQPILIAQKQMFDRKWVNWF